MLKVSDLYIAPTAKMLKRWLAVCHNMLDLLARPKFKLQTSCTRGTHVNHSSIKAQFKYFQNSVGDKNSWRGGGADKICQNIFSLARIW